MAFAEISVNSPAAGRRAYSYEIPPGMQVAPGQAVLVPFGERELQGIVLNVAELPAYDNTRPISGVIEPPLIIPQSQLHLARWVAEYYLAPLFSSITLALPPGFARSSNAFYRISNRNQDTGLSPSENAVFEFIDTQKEAAANSIEKRFGKTEARTSLSSLVESGAIERFYHLTRARVRIKTEPYFNLAVPVESISSLRLRSAKQKEILKLLAGDELASSEIRAIITNPGAAICALRKKGLVALAQREIRRKPNLPADMELPLPPPLTPAQGAALSAISESIKEQRGLKFLLHGVTASGKTEVYLQATRAAIDCGRRVLVLVPEIALTSQIIERFNARFPGRVGVLHSKLSAGERFDEWRAVSEGRYDVIVGPRSALFAPVEKLGLIIIDEEHEWAYKQQDSPPPYHARTAAIKLADLTTAAMVLGSATPDVETFYRAQRGIYRLLELPERVAPYPGATPPKAELVDLRAELKAGNTSVFSRCLKTAIDDALARGEQIILYYNRRGGATFIQCRSCGHTLSCRQCLLPLGYHPAENKLVCHHCNRSYAIVKRCPACGSASIKFLGMGTQRLEEETRTAFPGITTLRWDSDVTRGKDDHYRILERFRRGEARILIGTQVVAKGLDLPNVGLVGVINADVGLYLPDFRAGERTFQLLTQAAGRAGRGTFAGRVIIQTYSPDHYAVRAALAQDYAAFYAQEIEYRRKMNYPPFSSLAAITTSDKSNQSAAERAEMAKQEIKSLADSSGVSIDIIGPAPDFVPRLRGCYRWRLFVKGRELSTFLGILDFGRRVAIDIDPLGL